MLAPSEKQVTVTVPDIATRVAPPQIGPGSSVLLGA
jgi:hypothetical protein